MAEEIKYATFEQIATVLSNLAVNYSNLADKFYDVFYNSTPMDITIQLYNEQGVLVNYTFPNRAKDFTFERHGEGTPEGTISAPIGTLYQDTLNGNLYIKKSGTDSSGWFSISSQTFDTYPIQNSTNGITSGAVYNSIQDIQNQLGLIEQALREINGD